MQVKKKKVNCKVCLSKADFYLKHPEADLYRCKKCDHCFSDIHSMVNQENYSESYFLEDHKNWFDNPNFYLFNQIKLFVFKNNLKNILDVGCGKGDLLKYLRDESKKNNLNLEGLDKTFNKSEKTIKFYCSEIQNFNSEKKYDIITSLAVIEHIDDVRAFLDQLIKNTKPNGYILVMTLNDRSILYLTSRILNFLNIRYPFERLYSKHHLNHFNRKSLKKLGQVKNLEVVSHLDHNIPFKAIDFESTNHFNKFIFKIGALVCFSLGKFFKSSYLQTIIFRTPNI